MSINCVNYEQNILKESSEQPKITVFSDYNCSGISKKIDVIDHQNFLQNVGFNPASAWIPPNVRGTFYNILPYNNVYPGEGFDVDGSTDIYDSLLNVDKNTLTNMLPISGRFQYIKPWSKFKVDCCKGIGNKSSCGNYWRATSEQTTGSCDNIMNQYCLANKNDKICSCYYTEPNLTNNIYIRHMNDNPMCRSDCVSYGYKPNTLKNLQCPPFINCQQNITIEAGNSVFAKDIEQVMHCPGGQITDSSGKVIDNNADLDSNTLPNYDENKKKELNFITNNTNFIYMVVFFFIIVVFTSIIITISMSDDREKMIVENNE